MADQGQVRVVLGVDTTQARQQIDQFFAQIGKNSKVGDPFAGLDASFKDVEAQLKSLKVTWDKTTQSFKDAKGAEVSVDKLKNAMLGLGRDTSTAATAVKDFTSKLQGQDGKMNAAAQAAGGMAGKLKVLGTDAKGAAAGITGLEQPSNKLGVTLGKLGNNKAGGALKLLSTSSKSAQADMANAANKAGEFSTKIKTLGTSAGSSKQGVGTLASAIKQMNGPTQSASNAVGPLAQKLNQLGASGKGITRIPPNLSQLAQAAQKPKGPIDALVKKLEGMGSAGTESSNTVVSGFKAIAQGIPAGIGMAIGNAILAPLREIGNVVPAAVNAFKELDGTVRLTMGVLGASGGEFDALTTQILDVASATAATADEASQVQLALARAGMSFDEIGDALMPVVAGAEATGTAYGDMASIVASALGQFRLESRETTAVVDALVVAANSANQTVTDVGEALKYVGPVAASANQSIDEVGIALSILANNGIRASQAGTSLRTLLTNLTIASAGAGEEFTSLSRGSARLEKSMRLIGAEVTDANGELLPMRELLKNLRDGMSSLDTGERAIISKVLAGSEGLPTLNSLMSATDSEISNLADSFDNKMGAAMEAQKTAMSGLKGSFDLLNSAISASLVKVGSLIANALKPLVDMLTGVIKAFRGLPDPIQSVLVTLGLLGGSIGAVIAGLKLLAAAGAAAFAAKIVTGVKAFFSAFTVNNAATVIAATVTAVQKLYKAVVTELAAGLPKTIALLDKWTKSIKAMTVAEGVSGAVSTLGAAFQGVAPAAGNAAKQLDLFDDAADVAGGAAQAAGAAAGGAAKGGFKALGTSLLAFGKAVAPFALAIAAVAVPLKNLIDTNRAAAEAQKGMNAEVKRFQDIAGGFKSQSEKIRKGIQNIGDETKETVKNQEGLGQEILRWLNPFDNTLDSAANSAKAVRMESTAFFNELRGLSGEIERNTRAMSDLNEESDEYAGLVDMNAAIAAQQVAQMESVIAAIDSEISSIKERDAVSVARINALKTEKDKIEAALPAYKEKAEALKDEKQAMLDARGGNEEYAKSITSITNAYGEMKSSIDVSLAGKQVENSAAVAKGLKTEEEAVASNAAATVNAIDAKIQASADYIADLKEKAGEGGDAEKKATKLIEGETVKITKLMKDREEAQKSLSDAVKAAIDGRLSDYMREVSAIAKGYEQIGQMMSSLGSTQSSGIGAFKSLADAITNYQMTGLDKVNERRMKGLDTWKDRAMRNLDAEKEYALAAAGDSEARRSNIEANFDARRRSIENKFQADKAAAEESYAQKRRKIMEEQLNFQVEMADAAMEAASSQIEIERMRAQIANQVAINEAEVAVAKAEAAGVSEREMTALTNVRDLLKENSGLIDIQATAQQGVNDMQHQAELMQIRAKGLQEGVNVQVGTTVTTVDKVRASYEAWQKPLAAAQEKLGGMLGAMEPIPMEVESIMQDVRANIEGNLGAVSFDGLMDKFRAMGIPPEAAERMIASIDDSLTSGGVAGVQSVNDTINELQVSESVKDELRLSIAEPLKRGAEEFDTQMTEKFNQLPQKIPTDQIRDLLSLVFKNGSENGLKSFETTMAELPKKIDKDKLKELIQTSLKEGGAEGNKELIRVLNESTAGMDLAENIESGTKDGAQNAGQLLKNKLREATESLRPTMSESIEKGVSEGLDGAQQKMVDFASGLGEQVQSGLQGGFDNTTQEFVKSFSEAFKELKKAVKEMVQEIPVKEMGEQLKEGLVAPLESLQTLIQNLDLKPVESAMDSIKTSAQAVNKSGLNRDFKDLATQSRQVKSNTSSLPSVMGRAASQASSFARQMERAARAAQAASRARWSGGPVTGGETYQVNELGKELFMSNSGKISEINAPAFGTWRAPSSGTVIPAGIAQQVRDDAKSREVNALMANFSLTSAPGGIEASAGDSQGGALLKALKGMGGSGMNQTNNIQITSATPERAKNEWSLEMARLRLRRG